MYDEQRIDLVRCVQMTIIFEPNGQKFLLFHVYYTMNQDIYKLYLILIVTRQITTKLQCPALV